MHRKEVKFILNYLDNTAENLISLNSEFLATLKKQYFVTGVLTKEQTEFLSEIRGLIPILVPEKAVNESESTLPKFN
jgi:hypothetical protein